MQLTELVSRETLDKLNLFTNLLKKWNNSINLVSNNSIENVEQRHILDSVQLLNYIENKNISILDLGSGAGFPGIILSICGIKKVTLVESDSNKCAFLRQAAKISSDEIIILNDRIEKAPNLSCDILTSRALCNLNLIFGYTQNIKITHKCLLHKGISYESEIQEAHKHWLFKLSIHDSISSHGSKILEVNDIKARVA